MGLRAKFIGAIGQVTGSCHMLHDTRTDRYYLVDCGLFQGIGATKLNEARFIDGSIAGIPCSRISAVFLTHAHLDHCGMLPNLVINGFNGTIYCTEFTKWASLTTLYDSAKHGFGNYGESDVTMVQSLMRSVDEDEKYNPFGLGRTRKVNAKEHHLGYNFTRTSHLMGCVSVEFIFNDKPEDSDEARVRIQFGADTGTIWDAEEQGSLVKAIQTPTNNAQTIVLESTYGSRVREKINFRQRLIILAEALENACNGKRAPKIIIPSFTLQRTQEIILDIASILHFYPEKVKSLFIDGENPKIVSTSRMAKGIGHQILQEFKRLNFKGQESFANKKHPLFSECKNDEEIYSLIEFLFTGTDSDIYRFSNRFHISHTNLSDEYITNTKGCTIIIGSNGMCTGGGITHILGRTLTSQDCTVFLTGFQSPGTPGYTLNKISEGKKDENPKYFEEAIGLKAESIRASIVNIGRLYSGHADSDTLVRYCLEKDRDDKVFSPVSVILVHGDDSSRDELREKLQKWDTEFSFKSRGITAIFTPTVGSGWYDCKTRQFLPDVNFADSERLAIAKEKLANIQAAKERLENCEITTDEFIRIVNRNS